MVLLYSLGCIQTLPTCQTLMTLITLIIESFLSSEQITLTLSVQRPYLLTYSYNIVLLYSLGCIQTLPTCQTLMTLITLIIESFLSSEPITLTLSVQRPYLLTYSYDIVLLYSLGCIRPIPTCRTLITLITLIIESFLSSEQITLTRSVQRPYLLIYSYDIVLLYSLGCIHPIPTCKTLITLITLVTGSFLTIWTDTVQLPVNGHCKSRYLAINVICTTVLSLNIQLYNCIAVFHRLHPNTTYMPNTDDTVYTDNRVVFIIWTDNVNAICTTTISSNIQLWYCIAVFPRLYPCNTYLPNTDYTNYTGYRVVFNHLHRKRWLPSTGIHFFHLAVGTSSRSAHSFTESK